MGNINAGRPPTGEKKEVIQVLVRPVVKDYLVKASRVQNKSLSEFVNEILEWYHRGR